MQSPTEPRRLYRIEGRSNTPAALERTDRDCDLRQATVVHLRRVPDIVDVSVQTTAA